MKDLKDLIVCTLAPVFSYFSPIENVMKALLLLFIWNFLAGYLAGKIANREKFSLKKAMVCLIHASVFTVILASIFYIGDHLGNREGALYCVTTFCYMLLWFYSTNISRNLTLLFPGNKIFAFIYYVISIEFVSKVPFMTNFNKQVK